MLISALAAVLAAGAVTYTGESTAAYADVQTTTDSKTASDGKQYWVKNHLVRGAAAASDGLGKIVNALPGPDFLAVIDATEGSPSYGKVVNTATVGPLVENEPHHMQYVWHKGDTVYAGHCGTWLGLRLRPLFGLVNPKPTDSVC